MWPHQEAKGWRAGLWTRAPSWAESYSRVLKPPAWRPGLWVGLNQKGHWAGIHNGIPALTRPLTCCRTLNQSHVPTHQTSRSLTPKGRGWVRSPYLWPLETLLEHAGLGLSGPSAPAEGSTCLPKGLVVALLLRALSLSPVRLFLLLSGWSFQQGPRKGQPSPRTAVLARETDGCV